MDNRPGIRYGRIGEVDPKRDQIPTKADVDAFVKEELRKNRGEPPYTQQDSKDAVRVQWKSIEKRNRINRLADAVVLALAVLTVVFIIWWWVKNRSGYRNGGNFNNRFINSDAIRGIGMGRFGSIDTALVQDRIATKYSGRVITA
jgi:hypothetical protein